MLLKFHHKSAILIILYIFLESTHSIVYFHNATLESTVKSSLISDNSLKKLSLFATINFNGSYSSGPVCTKAFELVLDLFRQPGRALAKYDLEIDVENTECDDVKMLEQMAGELFFNDLSQRNRIPMAFLDECPGVATAQSAEMLVPNHYLGLTVALSTTDVSVNRRYNTYGIRVSAILIYEATVHLAKKMGWKYYAVWSEDSSYFANLERELFAYYETFDFHLLDIQKLPYNVIDSKLVEPAIDKLKQSGARIIMSHTGQTVVFACWLYRKNMYVSYFFVSSSWSLFNPDTATIPPEVASWCTRDMLRQVVKSWMFLGLGWMNDVFPDTFKDELGLSKVQMTELMSEKLYDAPNTPSWNIWAPACYDLAMFAAQVLETTEQKLVKLGTNLGQWTVGSENHRRNSSFLLQTMEEALFSLSVMGQKYFNEFDRESHLNTGGWTPVLFYQVLESGNGALKSVGTVYYQSSKKSFKDMIPGGLRWSTVDGVPPKDQAVEVSVKLAPNSIVSYSILSG